MRDNNSNGLVNHSETKSFSPTSICDGLQKVSGLLNNKSKDTIVSFPMKLNNITSIFLSMRKFAFPFYFFTVLLFSQLALAQTPCVAPSNATPSSNWGIVQKFQSNAVVWNGGTPTAADLNGDGISEILIPASDYSGYYVYEGDGSDATTATKKYVIPLTSEKASQPAIADLNGDGTPEVIINSAGNLYIFDNESGSTTNYLYKSTSTTQYLQEVNPYVVDINEDGIPEIALGNDIFIISGTFGTTGSTLIKKVAGPVLNYLSNNVNFASHPRELIIVDIIASNPGKEIVFGSRVYGVNLSTGVTTLLKDMSAIAGFSSFSEDYGPTAVADMDLDGDLDIAYNGKTKVLIWDPNQMQVLFNRTPPSFNMIVRGMPLVANVYNDVTNAGKTADFPELIIVNSATATTGILTAYNLNFNSGNQYVWSISTNDKSGSTGVTAFDFDGNGIREIIYRDETTLRIINGNSNTPSNYATFASTSATWSEYPIVADLDRDNEAEIAVTGGGRLQVFERDPAASPWKSAPNYWNQRNYRITNINSNLTVPATELSPTSTKAYNNNLAQLQLRDLGNNVPAGSVIAADASIVINSVTGDCPTISINTTISNNGSYLLEKQTAVALYNGNPTNSNATLLGVYFTPADIAAGGTLSFTLELSIPSSSLNLYAVVNDKGNTNRPYNFSSFPNSNQLECNYSNNISQGLAYSCADTDVDGVADYVDLDDDNDGVLDSVEGYSCGILTNNSQLFTDPVLKQFNLVKNGGFDQGNTNFTTSYSYGGLGGCGQYMVASTGWVSSTGSLSGGNAMQINAECGGAFYPFWNQTITVKPNTNYKLGYSIRHANFARVSFRVNGGAAQGNHGTTNSWVTHQNIINSGNRTSLTISLFEATGAPMSADFGVDDIFLIEVKDRYCTDPIDTDNDGIYNHLDLDSDGDGCTDAVEAGVTGTLNSGVVKNGSNGAVTSTNTLPNAIAAGPFGANGLANGLETTSESGLVTYASTYMPYAINSSLASCLDSDGDGVLDISDIDDDNDGVLDEIELKCISPLNAVTPTSAGATATFSDNNTANFRTISGTINKSSNKLNETNIDLLSFAGTTSGSITLENSYQFLKLFIGDIDMSESVTLKIYDYQNNLIQLNSNNIIDKGSYVNTTYPAGSSIVLTAAGTTDYDYLSNSINNITLGITNVAKRIEFYKTAGANSAIIGLLAGCNDQDTDRDGIANRLDLDSDGDGCSDASEAAVNSSILTSGSVTNLTGITIASGTTSATQSNAIVATVGSTNATFGNNGFANSLETSAESGKLNGYYTYDFANSKSFATCLDTDGDSVSDIDDVDDDNDGILDAVESPSCFYTSSEWLSGNRSGVTVSTSLAMSTTYRNPSELVDGINGTGATSYAVNFIASTTAAQTVYAFKMPVPIELKTIYLGYINANTHFNTGTVLQLEGSNDNITWTILGPGYGSATSVPGITGTLTANTFSVVQNRGKYLYYRIYWVSGGGVNASAYSNEVYFETYSNYQSSLFPKLDCISDTDADGIFNHHDLDADGDNCPDARETGVLGTLNSGSISNKVNNVVTTTTNVTGTIADGSYGPNGFADALETVAESGIYKGSYIYNFAKSSTVVLCTDSDNDGVVDLNDLDDDNDGVLDSEECPPFNINNLSYSPNSFTVTNGASASQTFPAAPDGLVVNVWTLDNSFNVRINGTYLTNPEELQFWTGVPTDALFEFLDGTTYSAVWGISGNKNKPLIRIYIDQVGRIKVYGSRTSGGALEEMRLRNGSFNNINLNTNATNTFQIGQAVVAQTFISGDYGIIMPFSCDDDNDGIPNGLDLDSDGDGCPDAKEAGVSGTLLSGNVKNGTNGAVTSTTSLPNAIAGSAGNYGANGLANVVETATESGIVSYTSTYSSFARSSTLSVCLDSDGDDVPDVLDIDDDNDGILDSIEQEGCFGTGINLRSLTFSGTAVIAKTANTITSSNTNSWISSYSNESFSLPLSFQFKRPTIGNSAMIGLLPAYGAQAPASYTNEDYKFYFTSTNVQVPFGTTYNTTQTATAQDEYSIDISATGYVTMKINGVQKAAFQGVNSAYKISIAGLTTTVFRDVRLSNSSNALVTTCTDTDNDGVPNYLDLDSDGDGCPDAKEANVSGTLEAGSVINKVNNVVTTTPNVANAIAEGDYGLNGFADALETTTESGVYSGYYAYEFATAQEVNACLDTDSDGIVDLIDIDDDNDGILDAIESPTCFFSASEIGKPTAISTELAPYSTYVIGNAIDASSTTSSAFDPNVNWVNKEIYKLTAHRPIPIAGIKFDLSTWAISNGGGNTFKLQGSNNNISWTDLSGASSSTLTTGSYQLSNTILPTSKFKFYRVIGVAGSSYYGGVTDIQFVLHSSFSESQYPKLICTQTGVDADTIPNHLDLDSDGDGCSDALEAGTTTATTSDFKFTGTDFGANGFKDGLEKTAPESNLYGGNYTTDYAYNTSVKVCIDSDNDGALDIVDLDDDNDGILDAIESPSCFYTLEELANPLNISSELAPYSTYLINNAIDANAATLSAFDPNINWVGKEIFKFTAKNYIAITGMSFDLVNWQISNGASNTFKLQGSGDNFYWTDLSGASSSTNTTGTYTIANTLATNTKFKYFRIIGVAGTSYYGGVYEARFNFGATTVPSANPKTVCTKDTDVDGIANHLDLDSDGDGCPDANEAGISGTLSDGSIVNKLNGSLVTTTNVAKTIVPGNYGANGFADTLETSENGVYTGVYPYYYVDNPVFNFCADTDNDGVKDIEDIDDDNDGILDVIESPSCFSTPSEASLPSTITTELSIYSTNIITNSIDNIATTYSAFNNAQNWVGKEIFRITPNVVGPIAISGVQMDLVNWPLSPSTASTFKLQGSTNNGTTWTDLSAAVSSTATTGLFTVSNTLNPTVKYNLFRIVGVAGTCGYSGVYELRLVLPTSYQASQYPKAACSNDTDNDGKLNHIDLDSDGDGCSDAKEVGTATNTTTAQGVVAGTYGTNGFADALETTADNGIYKGTYVYEYALSNTQNGCLDTDNDGLGNLLDIDDDNDGVLDTVENNCSIITTNKTGLIIRKPATINYSYNSNTINNLIDGVDANVYVANGPTGTLSNSPWFNFEFPTPKALTYLEIGHYSG